MAGMNLDGLKVVYDTLIEALERAKKEANPALVKAIESWAEEVRRSSKLKLSRPSWLLTSSIVDKVVDYEKTGKIWGIVGFEKTSGGKRTPGSYGQYHEAGWAPDRKVVKVPTRFLRRAKQDSAGALKKDIDDALTDVLAIFEQTIKRS